MSIVPVLLTTGVLAPSTGGGFVPSAFLTKYPTIRWWSPRQLAQADASSISQINDLSANANHLLQATGSAQPTCTITGGIRRAVFDTGDFLRLAANAALNIGSVTKLTIVAAIRHTSTATGVLVETGIPALSEGGASFLVNNVTTGAIGGGLGASSAYNFRNVDGAGATPRNYVASITFDTTQAAASEIAIRVDGIAQPTVSAAVSGTVSGNIPSPVIFSVGQRRTGSLPFNSQLFDLAVWPGAEDADDLARFEEYLFKECGF